MEIVDYELLILFKIKVQLGQYVRNLIVFNHIELNLIRVKYWSPGRINKTIT